MIETGKILQQRYRIDKQIGQGGMGAVYIATDERFGSTVAIKETLCMDDNYRKAIEREARLLNSLKHIALPRVTDHFVEDNGQFLVMEYISGEDLAHHLETASRPFPVDQVLTWADQLLDALDFLHNQAHPVIHRDIKPQNLKVTPKGQIVLLDFGLAKGNPTDAGHQTAAKSIFGYSRNYASLEQIQGTGTDPRSDLYSLAATLYHLLTNNPPEDALTRAMAVLSHQPDPLAPANAILADVPAGVAGVLQKSLALNAGQRPSSAAEMRAMLREHEKYEYLAAVAATPVTLPQGDIFSQHTRLMPGSTQAAPRQTDLKTEVMPAQHSHVTALKAVAGDTSRAKRQRGFGFASGAIAAVILLGSIAGGAYLVKPELFRRMEASPQTEAGAPVTTSTQEVDGAAANVNTVPVNSLQQADAGANVAAATATAPRTNEPAKPTRNQPATSQPAGKPDRVVVVDGNTIYMGNEKLLPDRPEIPNRMMDGNVAPPPSRTHMPPPADLRHLTPEQRRRVLRALRRGGVVVRPSPEKP